jgi:hypothetical protein
LQGGGASSSEYADGGTISDNEWCRLHGASVVAAADDNDVARFWPLAQTAIDRGDAASFARFISTQRLDGGAPVHLLNAHVLDHWLARKGK